MRRVGMFLAGLVGGYLVILFGWIGYAELAGVVDRDGGKIMGVAFLVAPAGAVLAGIVLAVVAGRTRPQG
ncbi:MAG: hypothetical protein IT557_15690 [Alphaproteobacteria bacterium]|nr:hypothetical protein [Alphaproteobacteria bacterium]